MIKHLDLQRIAKQIIINLQHQVKRLTLRTNSSGNKKRNMLLRR